MPASPEGIAAYLAGEAKKSIKFITKAKQHETQHLHIPASENLSHDICIRIDWMGGAHVSIHQSCG